MTYFPLQYINKPQWAQINFSTLNQRWFYVEPQLSSTILNVDKWLRNRWFWNNNQPQINFSTTIQPKSTKFEVEISVLENGWNLVDSWLIFGWIVVEKLIFWLIIVSKSTISQPNINVDIWLRKWSIPIGTWSLTFWGIILLTFNRFGCNKEQIKGNIWEQPNMYHFCTATCFPIL